jgi:hypothetical protein
MRTAKTLTVRLAVCTLGLTLTAGCSDQQTPIPASFATAAPTDGSTCGVSALKANPEKYLGDVTVSGRAAKVYPADSVVELSDEKACCAVYLFVPFTEAQRNKLGAEDLYQGTLPTVGAQITADAELKKVEGGYMLKVKEIRAGETVLVAMK